MLWKDREGSSNVEDRRGEGGGFGGGGPRFPMPRGKLGLAVLAVVLVAGYYGIDLTPLLGLDSPMPTQTQSSSYQPSAQEQELAKFSSVAENNRRDVGPNFCSIRQKVHSSENGALFRKHPDRMRIWSGCDGSVLLSVRP